MGPALDHDDHDDHDDDDDHDDHDDMIMMIMIIIIHCLDVGGRAVWVGLMDPINTIVETLHILSVYWTQSSSLAEFAQTADFDCSSIVKVTFICLMHFVSYAFGFSIFLIVYMYI